MTDTTTAWPFDADRHHPLAARRVPVIGTYYPDWRYEVALCVAPEAWGSPWRGLEPTALEADLIVQAIEYRMEYYRPSWAAKMRARALDVDGTTNTVILRKRPDGGWQYRRETWQSGLYPETRNSLPYVLDRCFGAHEPGGWEPTGWAAWKERNADLLIAVEAEWDAAGVLA